jgi:hypothetical protein
VDLASTIGIHRLIATLQIKDKLMKRKISNIKRCLALLAISLASIGNVSHKPEAEQAPQDLETLGPSHLSHPFLLADYNGLEPVEVELVDHQIAVDEPQFVALLTNSECEV